MCNGTLLNFFLRFEDTCRHLKPCEWVAECGCSIHFVEAASKSIGLVWFSSGFPSVLDGRLLERRHGLNAGSGSIPCPYTVLGKKDYLLRSVLQLGIS